MVGSEGTLAFIAEVTLAHRAGAPAQGQRAASSSPTSSTAARATQRLRGGPVVGGGADGPRLAPLGGGRSRACRRPAPTLGPDACALLVEMRAADRGATSRRAGRGGDARSSRTSRRSSPVTFTDGEGRVRAALGRPARALPGGGRGPADRHDRGHRGRGLPHGAPRRRHGRAAAALRARTATPRGSSSATPSTGTSTSSSPRTSATPPRWSATGASWTRSARWWCSGSTARSRASTAPAATWRPSSSSSGASRPTGSCGG